MQRSRGGLVFKAHRLLYHSTLGWRVIKKKKGSEGEGAGADRGVGVGEKLRDEHLEHVHQVCQQRMIYQVCAHPHKRGSQTTDRVTKAYSGSDQVTDHTPLTRSSGLRPSTQGSVTKGSHLRLIDFVYHSTLGLRVIKKLLDEQLEHVHQVCQQRMVNWRHN